MSAPLGRVEDLRSLVEDVTFPRAREWKEGGGKVVGSFPVYAPMELVHAAGMLPVHLFGAGGGVEIEAADSRIQSFVCSITRSTLELGLRGNLDAFDGFVFTNICDVARNLSGVFARNFRGKTVEYLHLPQNVGSGAAVDYMTGELRRLLATLERMGGVNISNDALAQSLRAFEENRALVRDLHEIRSKAPWLLPASEAYVLTRAGGLLPKEEHTRLLRETLAEIRSRSSRSMDKMRILLLGSFCEQPPFALLRAMEDAGCYVLDDDLALGLRFLDRPLAANGDPLRAIAEGFVHGAAMSSVCHTVRPKTEWLLQRARELQVDGVLFCTAKFCEPALYDYVPYKEVLEKADIPHLHVEFEEKMTAFEHAKTQVETFVESVMFG
ncbi:MAG TPA: 2-hydroxyacyl-CoA dehydratase [Thermoplasmata archaeon]|nr:2-hydroxyacyl-CoA dehydratase [Thermoplasmata archaeon]